MRVVDANVLVYSLNRDEPQHAAARRWLEQALTGTATVGFTWMVLLAFIRVSTRPFFPRPLDVGTAREVARSWLDQPPAVVIEPTGRHLDVVSGLLAETGTAGNLVSDAHLAALALEHDATVVTFDSDFGRFGVDDAATCGRAGQLTPRASAGLEIPGQVPCASSRTAQRPVAPRAKRASAVWSSTSSRAASAT